MLVSMSITAPAQKVKGNGVAGNNYFDVGEVDSS
jgi:hypothetical protein